MSPLNNLESEITTSELQRVRVFIICLTAGLCLLSVNFFIIKGTTNFFVNQFTRFLVIIWFLLFIAYEIVSYFFIRNALRNDRALAKGIKFGNIIVESLAPGMLLFALCYIEQRVIFVDSPLVFIYFILIVLSALYLNEAMSLVIGLISAGGYLGVTIWAIQNFDPNNTILQFPSVLYYSRSIIMFLTSLCAVYVTRAIKNRYLKTIHLQKEKTEIQGHLGQQLSPEIAQTLIKGEFNSEKQEVTILFLDIRNFTKYVEKHEPSEVINFQNSFFGPVLSQISKYEGITNQIMGDGLMATFGKSNTDKDHVVKAVSCGIQILREVKQLCRRGQIPPTKIGIGIHTGKVVMGNIGNEERKQFSISGAPVIIAARLEQATKKHEIDFLISEEVKNRLPPENFKTEHIGELSYHNVEQPIRTYSIDAS